MPHDIHDSYEGPAHWPWARTTPSGETIWLPAALLAALVLLSTAMRAFGDEGNLRWQRPNLPQSRESLSPRPMLREVPVTRTRSQSAAPAAAVREPSIPRAQKTYVVKQAAYTEEEGWARSDSAHRAEAAQFESVIVRRDDSLDLAQAPDPFPADPFGQDDPNQEDDLESQLQRPFGQPEPGQDLDVPTDSPSLTPGAQEMRQEEGFDAMDDPQQTPPPFDPQFQPDTPRDPGLPAEQPTFDPDRQFDSPAPARRSRGTGIAATPEERQIAEEACAEELKAIRESRIASISLEITPTGEPGRDFPFECAIDDGTPYGGRHWDEITYMWKAPANCHKPLYFEQVHAERYGHSLPPYIQPICSGAHFFGSLVTLPYQMGLTPPNECMYPLGHYRPGNCAPYMVPAVPITWRAVGAQAGAAVGVSAILP